MPADGPPIARRDVAIALVASVVGVWFAGWFQGVSATSDVLAPADPVQGILFLLVTVPLLWRRRAPVHAVAATLVGMGVHVALFGLITRCGIGLPILFVEAFSVAMWTSARPALLGLGLLLATNVVLFSQDLSAGWGGLGIGVPVTLAVWGVGRIARSRSDLRDRLADRNEQLRAARDQRARLEVATDRVRLSAELDALLRRRLSHLTRMADAGAGDDAAGALQAIEAESRATLEEMRSVVGVLRGASPAEDRAPQPTLTSLDALLAGATGARSRLTVVGSSRALPPGLELSAYRVVEHLLGALDAGSDTRVTVDFSGDAIELIVDGDARRRPDAAIERARERVALHQGTLEARVRDGRARVVAAFPVLAGV